MWRVAAGIAIVLAVLLILVVAVLNYSSTEIYADSLNKTIIIQVEAVRVLYADKLTATLSPLTSGEPTYTVECNRARGGLHYAIFLCNATKAEPGIYLIQVQNLVPLEGVVVVR